MHLSNWKASEWFTLGCFLFPTVALQLQEPDGGRPIATLLTMQSFLLRALYVSDEDFAAIEEEIGDFTLFIRLFTSLYAATFGKSTINYNMHVLSHAADSRKRTGALWRTGSGRFEASYGLLKDCFYGGTPNIPKQCLSNFFCIDRVAHSCQSLKKPTVSDKDSEKTDDTLVRIGQRYYKILSDLSSGEVDDIIICRQILTRPFSSLEAFDLDLP